MLLVAWLLQMACVKPRDFHAPAERMTSGTAWTLEKGTVAPEMGVGGTGTTELLVNMGVTWAPVERLETNANVAHFGVGLFNVGFKGTLYESNRWALGGGVSGVWARGDLMWFLSEGKRALVADLDALVLPLTVNNTWTVDEAVDITTGVSYTHSAIMNGIIDTELDLVGELLGGRRLAVDGRLQVYVGRVGLWAGGSLPVAVWVITDPATEFVADDSERAAGTHWEKQQFGKSWGASGGAQLKLGDVTYVNIGLASSAASRSIGLDVSPYVAAHWRL